MRVVDLGKITKAGMASKIGENNSELASFILLCPSLTTKLAKIFFKCTRTQGDKLAILLCLHSPISQQYFQIWCQRMVSIQGNH